MITASVVLYLTPEQELESLIRSYAPSEKRRLFIIDNSPQKSNLPAGVKNDPNIEYLYNHKNYGYGKSHNIGIKKAISLGAEYHIILNPDLCFHPDIVESLKQYADKNLDVAYILPQIVNEKGEIQHLCKLLPTPMDLIRRRFFTQTEKARKKDARYTLEASGYDRIINPPCLSGCFMFLRVSTLVNYEIKFDERFFMYCEDFDLIRRLHRVGKTIYYPFVTVTHTEKKASYKTVKMLAIHICSACKYFNKYGWLYDEERERMNKTLFEELGIEK